MKRTTVFLNEELDSNLKTLARRQQRSVASLIRDALESHVTRARAQAHGRLSFVAVGRSGHSDTASTHEDLLWADLAPHAKELRLARSTRTRRRAR